MYVDMYVSIVYISIYVYVCYYTLAGLAKFEVVVSHWATKYSNLQGSHSHGKSWKVMEKKAVMEKSWKLKKINKVMETEKS